MREEKRRRKPFLVILSQDAEFISMVTQEEGVDPGGILGQRDDFLVADSIAVIQVELLQLVEVLGNEADALLTDWAPLDRQPGQFPHAHGDETQGGVRQALAAVLIAICLLRTRQRRWGRVSER